MATKKVLRVLHASLTVLKTHPPALHIHALGLVPTGGWTNGRLVPYMYIDFPADGIWDFDFEADEPQGIVPQVISVITADYNWPGFPENLEGVRIHSSSNKIEVMIRKENIIEIDDQPAG